MEHLHAGEEESIVSPSEEIDAGEGRRPRQMPNIYASDTEWVDFFEQELSRPIGPREEEADYLKSHEFYLDTAKTLLPKLKDEKSRGHLAALIARTERAH